MTVVHYDVSGVPPQPPFPLASSKLSEEQAAELRSRLDEYRYPLFTVEELGAFPPVEYLIPDRLAAGEMTCLYGKGGSYKSFVALGWSCELAAAGHEVVYIAAEGASGLRPRVAAWQKHHGVESLPELRFQPSNVSLHEPDSVREWLHQIRTQIPDGSVSLVVIDTLARNFVGGSESDPKDMGLFVEGCERIRRELKSATLILHHEAKQGGQERGTEALRNATFAMFNVKKKAGSGTIATLKCDRIKEAEEPPDLDLRLAPVELPEMAERLSSLALADSTVSEEVEPANEPANHSPDERRVLTAISKAKDPANRGLSPKEVQAKLKVGADKAREVCESLAESGYLEVRGKTKDRRWTLTEKGRQEVIRR